MKRREFITLIGSAAAAWPVMARAQQAMPTIGLLSSRTPEADALVLPAFRRGLAAQGYVEGKNVRIEYRSAGVQFDRLRELAADLVSSRPAVIVAIGDGVGGTRAARAASATVPIVFITGGNPLTQGLVKSLNRPEGNITGVTAYFRELGPKRLELMHELMPRFVTAAILINPQGGGGADGNVDDMRDAAQTLGKQIRFLTASADNDLDAAIASLEKSRPDVLLVDSNSLFLSRMDWLVAAAARLSIPGLYFRREFPAAGGLMSYGSSGDDNYRVLGDYAGRILKGARADQLPVQQPTKFELVLNIRTAKTLGIAVPPTLLARADEVIE